MVNVPRQQSAQRVGILACASAPAFVRQELYAIDVGEDPGMIYGMRIPLTGTIPHLIELASLKTAHQLGDFPPILWGRRKSEFFFESLLENRDVPVLTEHQWDDEPMVAGSNLAVRAYESLKLHGLPPGDR